MADKRKYDSASCCRCLRSLAVYSARPSASPTAPRPPNAAQQLQDRRTPENADQEQHVLSWWRYWLGSAWANGDGSAAQGYARLRRRDRGELTFSG